MTEEQMTSVTNAMRPHLNDEQMRILVNALRDCDIIVSEPKDLLDKYLEAKRIEGCSGKTISYYESTLKMLEGSLGANLSLATTDDLRAYLSDYESSRGSSKTTIDNIRRIITGFYSWLEDEGYIVKSPARRIHRVKVPRKVKHAFTDEEVESLREACSCMRDLAIVDLLASTGMRVGELVALDREDLNLTQRECLVTGKGNKQRVVYFDARAKMHLSDYLETRTDNSRALFVALNGSKHRITVGAVELRIRDLGRKAGVQHAHPHKFRRTLATNAIDKGMPIEQLQTLLGHEKIETTMHYALVNQGNVKASHRRYLG